MKKENEYILIKIRKIVSIIRQNFKRNEYNLSLQKLKSTAPFLFMHK